MSRSSLSDPRPALLRTDFRARDVLPRPGHGSGTPVGCGPGVFYLLTHGTRGQRCPQSQKVRGGPPGVLVNAESRTPCARPEGPPHSPTARGSSRGASLLTGTSHRNPSSLSAVQLPETPPLPRLPDPTYLGRQPVGRSACGSQGTRRSCVPAAGKASPSPRSRPTCPFCTWWFTSGDPGGRVQSLEGAGHPGLWAGVLQCP